MQFVRVMQRPTLKELRKEVYPLKVKYKILKENRGFYWTFEDCQHLDTFYIAPSERESWAREENLQKASTLQRTTGTAKQVRGCGKEMWSKQAIFPNNDNPEQEQSDSEKENNTLAATTEKYC